MKTQYFKPNLYKTYRSFWLMAGFFWDILVLDFIFRHEKLHVNSLWVIIIIIGGPFLAILYRRWSYIGITQENIIFR